MGLICLVQTSFWLTMDCAKSVSYCVTVFACCLVLMIDCWNKKTMWSSLYAPYCAISSCLVVTVFPLSFNAVQPGGRLCIISMNCSSVYVARSSVKRESETNWGPGADDAWELLRFDLRGAPHPLDGNGGLQSVML